MTSVLSKTEGVAQLQRAKNDALEKVEQARTRRTKWLKEAKYEAKIDADSYKCHLETHYKELQQQVDSQQGYLEEASKAAIEEQLNIVSRSFASNREAALELLLATVLEIKPELHKNFAI